MNRFTYKYLFSITPPYWDLRGSPFLWDKLKEKFADNLLPDSFEIFKANIETAFQELTGCNINEQRIITCNEFAHGGMSSGEISLEFWSTKLFPFLEKVYRNLTADIEESDKLTLKSEMNTRNKDVFVFLSKKLGYNYYALFSSEATPNDYNNPLIIGIKKSKIKELSLMEGIDFYSKKYGFI